MFLGKVLCWTRGRGDRTAAYYSIGPGGMEAPMAQVGQAEVATRRQPRPGRAPRVTRRRDDARSRGSGRQTTPMLRRSVDGPALMRAVRAAVANLEAHVDEVDALNVFPVPDGDTGSNMLATMRAALAEAERLPADRRDLASVAEALSRGALTGARGNSGVILSQIIRGMTYGADGGAARTASSWPGGCAAGRRSRTGRC